MDCRVVRRILREGGPPVEASTEAAEALRHAADCGACRAWAEGERAWREALRDRLPPIEVPLPVKERLFGALSEARVGTSARRQRVRWVAALVLTGSLSAALGGLWWWHEAHRDGLLTAALAEDHLLYAARPAPAEFSSDDPGAVARWFAGRVDFAVPPPVLPGAQLLGGRLCTLTDRRAALWLYSLGDRRLSLFQMSAQGLPLGSFRPMTRGGRRYLCGHRKGVSVLAWTGRDLLFALVSDLPEDELLRLASS